MQRIGVFRYEHRRGVEVRWVKRRCLEIAQSLKNYPTSTRAGRHRTVERRRKAMAAESQRSREIGVEAHLKEDGLVEASVLGLDGRWVE